VTKSVLLIGCAAIAAAVAAGSAAAKFTPAWTYVPATERGKLATASGGTLYLPARTPPFYRYRSGAGVRDGVLSARFTNRVRVRQGVWRWTKQSFLWRARPLPAGTTCRDWASAQKTLQVDGNKVFWSPNIDGGIAWRCVTDRRGRGHVLSASQGGKLPDVALAIVVAGGVDVAGRT
jgi:hypothetical protein